MASPSGPFNPNAGCEQGPDLPVRKPDGPPPPPGKPCEKHEGK